VSGPASQDPVLTVAAGAGFAGDRIEPAVALAASGVVDAVALECLAERTMVAGLRERSAGRSGADPRLRARLAPLLPVAMANGCKVISNLGSADPAAAAEAIAALARELGLGGLRVAAVLGDDVADRVEQVRWSDAPSDADWLGAHAYLGSESIAGAIGEGADVVVTGRVADSALWAGPLRSAIEQTPDALAGALTVGHLMECTAQLSGGNHRRPGDGWLAPHEMAELGYPLADVYADGAAEIALLPGCAGLIDRFTCTLQLLYEVHDPAAYVTPDGVLDLTGVTLETVGRNRVRVAGARLRSVPEQLKVSGFLVLPGAMADVEIGYAGPDALARARDAAEVLRLRFQTLGLSDPTIDIVGVDSLLGKASSPLRCEPPEVRVHASVPCADAAEARTVEDEVIWLSIGGPPAAGGIRSERRDRVEVIDGRIDRAAVVEELYWASA
jgi:hypothetical protein